jgi:hypothetical protein
MSSNIANKTRDTLGDAVVDALWVQWGAIGGMTSANRDARSIVDPEALVLASLAHAPHERRLESVLHDWLVVNSDLLSIQRLKNLAKLFPESVSSQLGGIAKLVARQNKDFRWSRLAAEDLGHDAVPAKPKRSRIKSTSPDLRRPSAIMLRLRVGLGIGNKADVLSYMLGSQNAAVSVRDIAEATTYSIHALHRTVDDLALAGLIQPTDDSPARYQITGKTWKSLLELDHLATWSHWSAVYALVAEFDRWTVETHDRTVSPYAFGVTTLELTVKYRDVLRRASVGRGRGSLGGKGLAREPIEDWNTTVAALSAWIRANA